MILGKKKEWLEKTSSAREGSWPRAAHSLVLTVRKAMEWDHVNAVVRFIFPAELRFFWFPWKAFNMRRLEGCVEKPVCLL